jgi:hypothetical protein
MAHGTVAEAKTPKRLASMTAAVLILTTLVEMLAIWHHPHVQDHDPLHATLAIIAVSHLAGWIHGLAIGCCLLIAYCLGELLRIRIPAPLLRAAALVYAAGIVGWITAATVDGWVLERLASGLAHDTPSDLESNARLFKLCMAWVVASTGVGVALTSVGIFFASAGLLLNGRSWQIAGALGVLIGAALVFAIGSGHLVMDGHGARVAVGLQGLWCVLLGAVSLKASWHFPATDSAVGT